MIHHVYQGDGYEVVAVPVTSKLAAELRIRAGEAGLDMTELILDLFVGALRSGRERGCPTFTVSDDHASDFISDGFRVVARHEGQSTLCPFDGLPFDDAMSEFRAANLTDVEILDVARS
jgi:hypothetical protein